MVEPRTVHTGFVETNGTFLYYDMLGAGPALALLHGGYLDRRMWDDQFASFAQDYQVLRYDIRGLGQSPMPPVPYADWQDLAALLTTLGIAKATLLGFSIGGLIALDFTLAYPERVEALVLVGAAVNGASLNQLLTVSELEDFRHREQAYRDAKSRRDIPAMVEALMRDPTLVPPPEQAAARQRVWRYMTDSSFAWVLDPASTLDLDPPAWRRLHEINVPTLVVVGEHDDLLLHRYADHLERALPHVRRVTIPGARHMVNLEQPEAFTALVREFLQGR